MTQYVRVCHLLVGYMGQLLVKLFLKNTNIDQGSMLKLQNFVYLYIKLQETVFYISELFI